VPLSQGSLVAFKLFQLTTMVLVLTHNKIYIDPELNQWAIATGYW